MNLNTGGVHHLALVCKDMKATHEFYTDILKMELTCAIHVPPFAEEEAMQYMMLIYQGTTPTPPSEAWDALPDDEKQLVYGAYKALNETPGVTPGQQMDAADMATTVKPK